MKNFRLLIITVLALISGISNAETTWYVNATTGNNDNDGLGAATAFATIKKAVTASAENDIISLAEGTYTQFNITIEKNLSIIGEGIDASAVILQAQEDEPDYQGTDAADNKRLFTLAETANLSIKNLTLRYGNTSKAGGAITLYAGQTVNMDNCNILNCYSTVNGGAIASFGTLNINNSCIANNIAGGTKGGAIYGSARNANLENNITINNSVIYRNAATGSDNNGAGAICSDNDKEPRRGTVNINNSTLAYNYIINPSSGTKTNGIRFNNGNWMSLTNSILFNSLENKGGSGLDISSTDNSVIDINNEPKYATNHHNIISMAWDKGIGTDCITKTDATEALINFGAFEKGINGVYALPILAGSIAIDAADQATATTLGIFNTNRGITPDIGAYEYTGATNIIKDVALNVNIAPNPNKGVFSVNVAEDEVGLLEVYALNGQLLYTTPIYRGVNKVTLPYSVKGMVLVKIRAKGQNLTQKMLVK